jgi:hypothetical protein
MSNDKIKKILNHTKKHNITIKKIKVNFLRVDNFGLNGKIKKKNQVCKRIKRRYCPKN